MIGHFIVRPLTPKGRTERKENVWYTFLANGPDEALAFEMSERKERREKRQLLFDF